VVAVVQQLNQQVVVAVVVAVVAAKHPRIRQYQAAVRDFLEQLQKEPQHLLAKCKWVHQLTLEKKLKQEEQFLGELTIREMFLTAG
jgi:predicted acetyltransferase